MTSIVFAPTPKGRMMSQPPYYAKQQGIFGAEAVGDEVDITDDRVAFEQAIAGTGRTPSVNGRGLVEDYVEAKTATAGTPGTFGPTGATAPENLADLASVTASPASAWTTGQRVVLGDATTAHWSGTAWVAGNA